MTTEEHLNKILEKCRAFLAIAKKRTPGKWRDTQPKSGRVQISCVNPRPPHSPQIAAMWNNNQITKNNAAFILN